ncbi:MAG: asparagine synthase (glutamine-hydrolyzing) [Prolixibacteraceae bacterium]|jgi:asparagine synthase (glutamine-hydrolysing)|nr:asparagine synthase (glutamine-hydrolyzing) [Prolixibacteraceae bacterium]
MCGILGILGFEPIEENRTKAIMGMTSTLQHRGPDGFGYYISPDVALGQTRLSIIDLSTGDQPFTTEKSIMVYNGEVYNYIEIRKELEQQGVRFKSTSDTEVIVRAYEFYGEECLSKFNGQFAFLIWNKEKKELFAARDRFGIRPLYILDYKGSYYFSSEMKAFDTIQEYSRQFDIDNLFEHALFWNTTADATVFKNIRSLPGGSFIRYKQGKVVLEKKYYEIGQNNSFQPKSYNEAKDEFNSLLNDAVKLRLRSDVPVGAYLSGGIDSSVITHLIHKNKPDRLKTFSITFENKEFDESQYQKEMIQKINSDHVFINITNKKIDDALPQAVYHAERPIFRTAAVPLFLLSEKVRENNIKVVLTGEGADELLYGYDSYKELKMLKFWSKFPNSKLRPLLIKKLYPHLNHYNNNDMYGLMKMYYEGFLGDFENPLASLNIRIHNNKAIENYFNKDYNISFQKDTIINHVKKSLPANYDSWDIYQKNQFLEMKTLLSGYLLSSQGDRMSLAHSIEGRYPFLDHRIVDSLFYANDEYKMKGLSQKHLLRDSYSGEIPDSIINRPKKPYIAPDLSSFFRDGKPTENTSFFLNDSIVKDYGIWDPKYVARFIGKFKNGVPDNVGYRDNMLVCFMLSTQIVQYWINNPIKYALCDKDFKIKINDYKTEKL